MGQLPDRSWNDKSRDLNVRGVRYGKAVSRQ